MKKTSEWCIAEIEAHLENGTWELAQLPARRRAIGLRWVFKVKRKADGSIDKYKGRIVAQGCSQVRGIHYNEVFVLTTSYGCHATIAAADRFGGRLYDFPQR